MRRCGVKIFLTVLMMVCGAELAAAGPAVFSPPLRLDETILDCGIELAGKYLLASQKDEGNFIYEYDFLAHRPSAEDNQVRQAGALWGLALFHKEHASARTFAALERGLDFFKRHSRLTGNARYVVYPGEKKGSLGAVALVTLTLLDFIPSIRDQKLKDRLSNDLNQYLNFLLSARRPDGLFFSGYDVETGTPSGDPSPYSDGEALLALAKAARLPKFSSLKPLVLESADAMYRTHVLEALKKDADSPVTKGFYQWGTMSFFEIYQAKWPNHQRFGRYVVDLAVWMIDVHQILKKAKNTAYAYEGLSCAFAVAKLENHEKAAQKIASAMDEGLYRLISWQKGSPLENEFLKHVSDRRAWGGVMNGEEDPILRIDVTQHQLHALMLARRHLYSRLPKDRPPGAKHRDVFAGEIEQAILLAGEYLKNAVKEDGSFVYEYFPQTAKENSQYNMLRHAGTIYAMAEIYEHTGDKVLLEKIRRVIAFLLSALKGLSIHQEDVLVALDDGQIKLGANALAILALAKVMDVTRTNEHLQTAQKLARWIQLTQSPQGRFLVHKQDFPTQKISDFESGYYPGEAIYALTFLYRLDKNEAWLDTAEKAAQYLIYVRDGGKTIVGLSHDHWLLYGLNELYRLRPRKIYYDHALKIAEAILSSQDKALGSEKSGGFSAAARSTSAATRIEGLCAVRQLVRDYGTPKELEMISNGIFQGVRFPLKCQVTRETAAKEKWPSRAVGGFLENPQSPAIRIDCVQHNVSALLGVLRALQEGY
jgi:hypothetical protein